MSEVIGPFVASARDDLISEAFVKAQGEMPNVKKDEQNPFYKSKYASLAAVIADTRPVLAKHGLAMRQIMHIVDGKVTITSKVRHVSGQELDCGEVTLPIGDNGGRSEAQEAGSVITYLRRYAWQTALGIATEDDDGNSAPPKPAKAAKPIQRADEYIPPEPEATLNDPPPKTDQTRMRVLNALQAAPGQPNRDMVTRFLRSKAWVVGADGQPESWPLDHVPNTPRLVRELGAEIAKWETKQSGGAK